MQLFTVQAQLSPTLQVEGQSKKVGFLISISFLKTTNFGVKQIPINLILPSPTGVKLTVVGGTDSIIEVIRGVLSVLKPINNPLVHASPSNFSSQVHCWFTAQEVQIISSVAKITEGARDTDNNKTNNIKLNLENNLFSHDPIY